MAHRILFAIFIAFSLVSCEGFLSSDTPEEAVPTEVASPLQKTVEAQTESLQSLISLILWIPPEFNLAINSEASTLLNSRINEFQRNHPNLIIEVRVKASEGSANLLDSLVIAQAAAPLSMPDLVLLPSDIMEIAAENQLLNSMDEYLQSGFNEDWYEIATEHGIYNNEIYGLSFALDALILNYHPQLIESAPNNWTQALNSVGVLSFPAADPQFLFMLSLYLGQVDNLVDEDNLIFFDSDKIQNVFTFIESGVKSNMFPYWLSLHDQEEFSWQAFKDGRASMAISWAHQYLISDNSYSASTIPTENGSPFSLTSAWVFSLPKTDSDNSHLATELASFLTESEFIGEWSESMGYLPPRPSSLSVWQNVPKQALANLILSSAGKIPSKSILNTIGDKLMVETVKIIKNEQTAIEATNNFLDQINN